MALDAGKGMSRHVVDEATAGISADYNEDHRDRPRSTITPGGDKQYIKR